MAATATWQFKIEPELKSEAVKYFAEVGMNASAALRAIIKNALQTRAVPFQAEMEKVEEDVYEYDEEGNAWKLRPEFAASLLKAKKDIKAGRNVTSFNTMDDFIASLDKRTNQ